MGRGLGIDEERLRELPHHRQSDAFSADERLVLDLAVEMARTPVEVPEELDRALRVRFDEGQLVELTAAIAWEGYRARFNRVHGVRAVGFAEGSYCALPERPASDR
ncbi:MAG TPA: hypothetical protein VGR10_06925 [Thermoleophilaceae bacterium]|nr:hypothetical protein [Thermoleophilaceae bacterium]